MRFPRALGDFVIRDSPADGRGIFATRRYASGELLFGVEGTRIHGTDPRLTHRAIQFARGRFIEPRRFSLGHYLNHSCAPNAYVDGTSLFARSGIRPGEEVTVDYSLFTSHPSWDMECACGAANCRGLILPYDRLPAAIRRSQRRWTSSYLLASA
ncbi:MAG: SET domain-containing protein-lysine N-methyltransferase [Verrucomicrobiae bacterium]|nr:SET domain-containing protein-lysine N-methyltransferase [Verrucomicrobiae bacterium]